MSDNHLNSGLAFGIPNANAVNSIIKVLGVGGGGSNAVSYMYNQGIQDVQFVVCNTDIQALERSPVPNKLQIGEELTKGLGAGANPEIGRKAALESKEQIKDFLNDGTRMLFITAGMGGGTGTGAAPVIAEVARELGILTVGIVTSPFQFEGPGKLKQAKEGIRRMHMHCDTVITILNDQLFSVFPNLKFREGFGKADVILTDAAKSIAEMITENMIINIDFADVSTVIKDSGSAVMGSAMASGEDRALKAAEESLTSPLLNNHDISGATKILLFIKFGPKEEVSMDEMSAITEFIREKSGVPDMIWGMNEEEGLGDNIKVTIVATGFDSREKYLEEDGESANAKPIELTEQQQVKLEQLEREKALREEEQAAFEREALKRIREEQEALKAQKRDEEARLKAEQQKAQETQKKEEPTQGEFVFGRRPELKPSPKQEIEFSVTNDYFGEELKAEEERQVQGYPEELTKKGRLEALENKKKRWMEEAKERRRKLRGGGELEEAEFRRSNLPAYRRRQIKLDEVSENENVKLSSIVVTPEHSVMRNNFLNDNPD